MVTDVRDEVLKYLREQLQDAEENERADLLAKAEWLLSVEAGDEE